MLLKADEVDAEFLLPSYLHQSALTHSELIWKIYQHLLYVDEMIWDCFESSV